MSPGVRQLTVLGNFKPFGLIAEALDGKPAHSVPHHYDYFLFDPEIARERDETDGTIASCLSTSNQSDHELFIRGNRIIWSTGARVFKRFTLPSPIIKVCWCRLGDLTEALLCVLQTASLTIYNTSGEVVTIPISRTITSIWSFPFGLLMEQAVETNPPVHVPFLSSSPLVGIRDIARARRETGHSPQSNACFPSTFDQVFKGDTSSLSTHLILKDPLESPQPAYIEERGKLNVMKEFDERTIWTSDQIPLMASYNRGKMQHSVWVAHYMNSNHIMENTGSSDVVPDGVLPKYLSFQRIWQGKGAQTAACKVFLATDDDTSPIICFLHKEQKKLFCIRLQSAEINNEILFDVKPDMSWSISAVAAASVRVTRPRVMVGLLPYSDIIALAPDSTLFLYSGKQCLCRYMLPPLCKGLLTHISELPDAASVSHESKIIGLTDAVEERLNIITNNGQIFRCSLRRSPLSLLVSDCVTALAEGLTTSLYNHFFGLLWEDGESSSSAGGNSILTTEWDSFSSVIMQMCNKCNGLQKDLSNLKPRTSWEFLVSSKFHKSFGERNFIDGTWHETSSDTHKLEPSYKTLDATQCSEKSFYSQLLADSLDCLHAVYENLKLEKLRKRDLELLSTLLCDISWFLGQQSYLDHYIRDFPCLAKQVGVCIATNSQKKPASLFRWLENCLLHGHCSAKLIDLPPLILNEESSVVSWARKIVAFYSLLAGSKQTGKKLSTGVYCNIAMGSHSTNEELVVLAMVGEAFGQQQLDLLPSGVSLPLRHALDKCRESPPNDWPAAAYALLGREDLAMSHLACSCKHKEFETQTNINLISMSTPYMLHLHPVTIPSAVCDTMGLDAGKIEDADSIEGSTTDGMEHIFNSSTQLQYGRDLRLNEVRRLLCSARPVAIQTSVNPSASDQDLQQAQLWQLAQRTTSLPFGRGAFTLATIYTLLTEAFVVPKLVLAGRLPAQQNATVNLDPNVRNVAEIRTWPEFHNAVAAGLRLAPLQGKMSRTWIIYNRPEEPNAVHAGLLLALGLHGYLCVLTITDIYQYYAPQHEATTVGLMLGLAASYRGTMQPSISKSLYVHIPSRHPYSYSELELPTLLQSAALMSLGLLYEGSAHPQTMQILLGEIGRRSGGDNVLEREGYAVSAGFSLGLVALGRGKDSVGFTDSIVDRLFNYIGGKEVCNPEISLFSTEEHNRMITQMVDGTVVNVDVTAPGATIALALMFLKTESVAIMSKLSIPQTNFDLQYVRPDFIMIRVIARNLIMWSRVHPSRNWVESQIPEIVKNVVKCLKGDDNDTDELDAEAFVQAYVNIIIGACISLGLRFAGTKNGDAQELLYNYAVYFLNEIKPISIEKENPFPKGLSRYIDRGTLETCVHLIALSLSVVMAGSGNLQTFRLLRFLRSRNSTDGHANYGIQMAVSLAIGFLFLGGGTRTFSTSNSAVAALLITLYPRLPTGPNDNRCHLQAFRHLYVLATEARWIQTVDVDTGLPVYAPLEITVTETEHYAETTFCEITPCLLPERATLKNLRICSPRYWPQVMELAPEDKPWWNVGDKNNPFSSGVLYIKQKVGACSYIDDPIGCQSLLSRVMHKVFGSRGLSSRNLCNNGPSRPSYASVDQLIGTFSSDPSLIAFAQLCCDPSWDGRLDVDFQEFCLQVLFECVSKDRPALLQVYLSLYTTVSLMIDQAKGGEVTVGDSLCIFDLKLAIAYNEALLSGKLITSRGSIVQSNFLGSLRKRVEEILSYCQGLKNDFRNYLDSGRWPSGDIQGVRSTVFLSWYLQWYSIPDSSLIKTAMRKIKPKFRSSSVVPLLHLLFPRTDINAILEMDKALFSA